MQNIRDEKAYPVCVGGNIKAYKKSFVMIYS